MHWDAALGLYITELRSEFHVHEESRLPFFFVQPVCSNTSFPSSFAATAHSWAVVMTPWPSSSHDFHLSKAYLAAEHRGAWGRSATRQNPRSRAATDKGDILTPPKKREKKKQFEVNRTASRDRSLTLFFLQHKRMWYCRKSTHSLVKGVAWPLCSLCLYAF